MPQPSSIRVPVRRLLALAFALAVAVPLWPGLRPATVAAQAAPSSVRVWEDMLPLPTYEEGLPDPNPPFDFFAPPWFNYPYTLRYSQTGTKVVRPWRTLNLENEYIRCTVLPDLGGHLYSCTDKINGAEVFYANPSIKFAQIAYRGAWTALGVEFNFPVSHNWMTASPVDFAMTRLPDTGASVWIGNIDRPYGMQWRVELTLRPGRAVLEQKTTLYNRNLTRQRFYWWTNAGVEVWDDSRIFYPMAFTASHGFTDVDTWPVDRTGTDLSVVGNHTRGPVSRFAHGSREPFMGVYHPKTRSGVVHYSDPTDLPAKKIWSWGSNPDGLDWRRALSDDNSAYVEVQAGLFRNQETYGLLEPQETIKFTEYWVPFREIDGLTRATPDAVLYAARKPGAGDTLEVRLNVTRPMPDATIDIACAGKALAVEQPGLAPERTYAKAYGGAPQGTPCTIVLKDSSGRVALRHTENVFDFTPAAEIRTGAQKPNEIPPAEQRSDGDWLAVGTDQEQNGQKLTALGTYRDGLQRVPASLGLLKAAGRLEVGLLQFDAAVRHLAPVLDRVSHDREAAFYLGLAHEALGNTRAARLSLELAQLFGVYRPAATFVLAGLTAREGDRSAALAMLERVTEESPYAVRAGAMRVALLRAAGQTDLAKRQVMAWLSEDPTSSMLKVEATRLGMGLDEVFVHLAGDPERILEIAADYMRFGLFDAAIELLGRQYPTGGDVISEPGIPRPESYPLIAYYRGYCRHLKGEDPTADFTAASGQPTTYVFPSRPDTLPVLREVIRRNQKDATAHFLLGSLMLAGGLPDEAMRAWETARSLNPRLPILHRNMGYTVLYAGGSPDQAVALFREGTRYDASNVGLYVGLERAMTLASRPAAERAQAILSYPDQPRLPASLVYKLASALAEAGRFDEAEKQFAGRFFPREEGGLNVRGVWVEVRLRRAVALADQKRCAQARTILNGLEKPTANLAFTKDGLDPFVKAPGAQQMIRQVTAACQAR